MTNKMTNKEALTYVLTNCEMPVEVREKVEKMLEQTEKKSAAGTKKPTKVQQENEAIKASIVEMLTTEGVRAGDVAKALEMSGQKASALLNQLVKEGQIRKVEGEKRVTLFALPVSE